MGQLFGEGFFLGISIGMTCLATCLPVIFPYLLRDKRRTFKSLIVVLWFLLGRFIGYIIFGALAGALGGDVPDNLRRIITAVAFIALGGFLIQQAFKKSSIGGACPAKKWGKGVSHPLLLGLLLGLSPCPAFLLAVSRAVEAGGALSGMILFAGFFFGTSVFFLPMGFIGELARFKFFRWLSHAAALLVGLWFIFNGILNIAEGYNRASNAKYEIVDPLEEDTVFIVGNPDYVLYLEDKMGPPIRDKLKSVSADSVPDRSFVVALGEMPDSADFLSRGIGIVHAPADSADVEKVVELISTYAFRRKPPRGFYFEVH